MFLCSMWTSRMFEVRCLHIPVTDRTPFEGKSTSSDVGFEEIVILFKIFCRRMYEIKPELGHSIIHITFCKCSNMLCT
jgi:hypothetical protein